MKTTSQQIYSKSNTLPASAGAGIHSENGFTLVEVGAAMLILLISLLGVTAVFAYAVSFNAGNSNRARALVILQQEVENLRSAKFTPSKTDTLLAGGTHATKTIVTPDGGSFSINVTVDDDPFVAGVQINTAKSIKEITATVTLNRPTAGWQTSVPSIIVLRRVRGN